MSESAGRKRNVHSVFPLHGKAQAYTPPVGGNFGRGLLASSHAGTRLPIAVFLARAQGAPPLPAPGHRGAAGFLPYTSFLQRSGKRQGHRASPFLHRDVPTVALPTSGQRVGAFAPSQPVGSPVFRRILLHFRQRLSRGLAKAGKGAYNIFIEKTGSPLARAERRLQGLDPKPDLDHANGGK